MMSTPATRFSYFSLLMRANRYGGRREMRVETSILNGWLLMARNACDVYGTARPGGRAPSRGKIRIARRDYTAAAADSQPPAGDGLVAAAAPGSPAGAGAARLGTVVAGASG